MGNQQVRKRENLNNSLALQICILGKDRELNVPSALNVRPHVQQRNLLFSAWTSTPEVNQQLVGSVKHNKCYVIYLILKIALNGLVEQPSPLARKQQEHLVEPYQLRFCHKETRFRNLIVQHSLESCLLVPTTRSRYNAETSLAAFLW